LSGRVGPITFEAKKPESPKERCLDFVVHLKNSMCHNARKIAEEIRHNNIQRSPHPAYSPDPSLWDVWLFVLLKKFKEQELLTGEQIIEAIIAVRDSVTFDELQSVCA
jgi:hypothetical protein